MIDQLRAELEHLLPMLLPQFARAATIEVTGSQVALRLYLHGPIGVDGWAALDAQFTPLIERRLPRRDAPWEVHVKTFRRDRPAPLDLFGAVVWLEDGTEVATRDGRGS